MEITITSRKREREKYGHYTPENRAQCAAQLRLGFRGGAYFDQL